MVMGWRDAQPGRLTSQPVHGTSTDSEARKHGELRAQRTGSVSGGGGGQGEPEEGTLGPLVLGAPSALYASTEDIEYDIELTPVKALPRVARRIFASTYNMGGSGGVLDPKQRSART